MPRSGRCGSKASNSSAARSGHGPPRPRPVHAAARSGPRIASCTSSPAPRRVSIRWSGSADQRPIEVAASRPCPPRSGAGGTPGPARGSAGSAAASQLAQGRSPMKLAGSRSPCAPMAAGASRASSVVSPTLIIQIVDRVGRALGEDRVHGVGDEDQPPSDRNLRPHRIAPVGRDALRIEADVEVEGRVAGLGAPWRGRAPAPARRRRSRPRAPPRRPHPAAARSRSR